jgi:hypothetical protein
LDGSQLQLFRGITLDYFAKLAPLQPPTLEKPYLLFGEPALLDFASVVRIQLRSPADAEEAARGCVYLTSPRAMLADLLAIHRESEVSDRTLADMCRELANVLSGNASRAFGEAWEISVPTTIVAGGASALELPGSAFVLPMRWRGELALLVVGLNGPGLPPPLDSIHHHEGDMSPSPNQENAQ